MAHAYNFVPASFGGDFVIQVDVAVEGCGHRFAGVAYIYDPFNERNPCLLTQKPLGFDAVDAIVQRWRNQRDHWLGTFLQQLEKRVGTRIFWAENKGVPGGNWYADILAFAKFMGGSEEWGESLYERGYFGVGGHPEAPGVVLMQLDGILWFCKTCPDKFLK